MKAITAALLLSLSTMAFAQLTPEQIAGSRAAAAKGEAWAQFNLAGMYYQGKGVPEDNVMAYMWINLAAAQGAEDAKKNKGIVQESMTPVDISKAQTLSRECLASDYKNCG